MRRILREIAYDLREPGIHISMLPIAAATFVLLAVFVQEHLTQAGRINIVTLPMLETLIPTLGGYGALMLMQGLTDKDGGDILFTYRRSILYWGLIRQFRFFALFSLLVAMVCLCISAIMQIDLPMIFILTLAQSFAVMAVAFLGISVSRDISIGLIIFVAFIGVQILLGTEFEFFNFIYVLDGNLSIVAGRYGVVVYNSLIIGTFCWGIGQLWLHPAGSRATKRPRKQ